jgi:hypothetical protein
MLHFHVPSRAPTFDTALVPIVGLEMRVVVLSAVLATTHHPTDAILQLLTM